MIESHGWQITTTLPPSRDAYKEAIRLHLVNISIHNMHFLTEKVNIFSQNRQMGRPKEKNQLSHTSGFNGTATRGGQNVLTVTERRNVSLYSLYQTHHFFLYDLVSRVALCPCACCAAASLQCPELCVSFYLLCWGDSGLHTSTAAYLPSVLRKSETLAHR